MLPAFSIASSALIAPGQSNLPNAVIAWSKSCWEVEVAAGAAGVAGAAGGSALQADAAQHVRPISTIAGVRMKGARRVFVNIALS
jgi:hypothetical protein